MKRIRKLFSLASILIIALLLVSGCMSDEEKARQNKQLELLPFPNAKTLENFTSYQKLQLASKLRCHESYELIATKVQYTSETHSKLSGGFLLCFGLVSSESSTFTKPIYQYWYKRPDGGILPGTIDFSSYELPQNVSIVVYENDTIAPKVEIWRNSLSAIKGDGKDYWWRDSKDTLYYPKTEFRFTIPPGTFVNTYDFQGNNKQ